MRQLTENEQRLGFVLMGLAICIVPYYIFGPFGALSILWGLSIIGISVMA